MDQLEALDVFKSLCKMESPLEQSEWTHLFHEPYCVHTYILASVNIVVQKLPMLRWMAI